MTVASALLVDEVVQILPIVNSQKYRLKFENFANIILKFIINPTGPDQNMLPEVLF